MGNHLGFEPCGYCGTSCDRYKDDDFREPVFCGTCCRDAWLNGRKNAVEARAAAVAAMRKIGARS